MALISTVAMPGGCALVPLLDEQPQAPALGLWKLSPVDIASRNKWNEYTKAKEEMLARTHTPESPWWVVPADDKKKARLNCIHHLLGQVPYRETGRPAVVLDVAHNPHAARALSGALSTMGFFPETTAVFAMLADKDIAELTAFLSTQK